MPKQYVHRGADDMHISADVPLHRPYLGLGIARVATYWSELEMDWAITYTHVLGNRDKDAFAEYFSLRDWKKRRKLFFNAADKHKLPGPLKTLAFNLYTEFEALALERNRVIHGVWAYKDGCNNSIFLAQTRNIGGQLNRIFTALYNVSVRPQQYPQVSVNLSHGTYDEYTHEDFEELVDKIRNLMVKVLDLSQQTLNHSLGHVVKSIQQQRQNK